PFKDDHQHILTGENRSVTGAVWLAHWFPSGYPSLIEYRKPVTAGDHWLALFYRVNARRAMLWRPVDKRTHEARLRDTPSLFSRPRLLPPFAKLPAQPP